MTTTPKATSTDSPSQDRPEAGRDPAACPECGSTDRTQDERRGETVCASCGMVLGEDAIDHGPEWRAFDAQQRSKRARTGPSRTVMRHDRGLGTQIGFDDGQGSSQARAQLSRMRRYHQRATYQPGADRNLADALTEIERLAGALDLPDAVAETAARLFRQAKEADFLHGRSIEATAAAVVYAAARIHETPHRLKHVTEAAKADHESLARTYRHLNQELELPVPILQPTALLASVASALDLPPGVERAARDRIETVDPKAITGKNPASVAAAAIYLEAKEAGEDRTQAQVAETAEVTTVTLRNRLDDLR